MRKVTTTTSLLQTAALASAAGIALALPGCAAPSAATQPATQPSTQPAKAPPTVREKIVEASIKTETVRDVWTQAAETGAVPDGWLKSFNDPRMEAVVIEALKHNLAMRGAAARVEAAAAAAVQAGAKMGPVVGAGASGGAGAVQGGGTAKTGGVGLGASWEIDVWGKLGAARTAAQEQFAAAQGEYEFARESLAAQTAKAWYFASDTQQQLTLAKETVGINAKLVDIVKTKARAGQVTPQDLNLAQADLASAQERERMAEGAHQDAVRSLEVLLGRYPSAELQVATQFVPVPGPVPAGIPSEVLDRRPDMIAAEARVKAAFQNVKVAKLAKLPSLKLTAGGGAASNGLLSAIGQGPGFFGIGANFLGTIYDGGNLNAQVKIENANQEQALAAYGQNALVAFSEVEKGLAAERLLAQREQLLATAVQQNEEALRGAQVRYKAGKIGMLDVLQIQSRTNLARAALIDIKQLRLAQRIDLYMALGGSFEEQPPAAQSTPAAKKPQ